MKVEISNGELVDKVTILSIKREKITVPEKLKNVEKEFSILRKEMSTLGISEETPEYQELLRVNRELWDIEDQLRKKEAAQVFDDEFIRLARKVYFTNDKRSEIKRRINQMTDSDLIEEKTYVDYRK
ncbi:hypothetical protein GF337_16930 [candidate division KSB1 bacterium]|nr:hypothetical protein [candidate division KSB1 bacterium]